MVNIWGNRTRMIARLAIRQRAVSIEANISVKKISLPQGPPPPPKKRSSSAWNRTQALLPAGTHRYHYTTWEHKKRKRGSSARNRTQDLLCARPHRSGIGISTLEIRQERTSRFYLRVEWTSVFKGFHQGKGCTSTAVSGLILGSLRSGNGDSNENYKNAIGLGYVYMASDEFSNGWKFAR